MQRRLRVAAIHGLFDGDHDGLLSREELERLFVSCYEGLNRSTKSEPIVSVKTVAALATELWDASDGERGVSAKALRAFVAQDAGVVEYLGQFLSTRMVFAFHERREEYTDAAVVEFLLDANETKEVEVDRLRHILRGLPGSPATAAEIDAFAALLDENGGRADGLVGLDEFADAIAAWVSFSIVDEDESGTLDCDELKLLMWVAEGAKAPEPTDAAVRRSLEAMDKDGSGAIDRMEWIAFMASHDPLTGAAKFSRASRAAFVTNDEDGSSDVSSTEVRATFVKALRAKFVDLGTPARRLNADSLDLLDGLVKSAGDEVMALVDEDRDGTCSFSEYAKHAEAIAEKQGQILKYARVLLEHQLEDQTAFKRRKRRRAALTRVRNVLKFRGMVTPPQARRPATLAFLRGDAAR